MDIQHVNAKLFVDGPLNVDGTRLIEVFHQWVREQVFPEILVDVADYRHVPKGPSVMIVGHEADYVMDDADGRAGLRYNRRATLPGSNVDRFTQAIRSAATAALRLRDALGRDALEFSGREIELTVADRALAPNTSDTFTACRGEIERAVGDLLGHGDFSLRHRDDPRRLFCVTVVTDKPFDLATLA